MAFEPSEGMSNELYRKCSRISILVSKTAIAGKRSDETFCRALSAEMKRTHAMPRTIKEDKVINGGGGVDSSTTMLRWPSKAASHYYPGFSRAWVYRQVS